MHCGENCGEKCGEKCGKKKRMMMHLMVKKLEKCQNAEDVDNANAPVAFHRNSTCGKKKRMMMQTCVLNTLYVMIVVSALDAAETLLKLLRSCNAQLMRRTSPTTCPRVLTWLVHKIAPPRSVAFATGPKTFALVRSAPRASVTTTTRV